jgi:hypothetical protein
VQSNEEVRSSKVAYRQAENGAPKFCFDLRFQNYVWIFCRPAGKGKAARGRKLNFEKLRRTFSILSWSYYWVHLG